MIKFEGVSKVFQSKGREVAAVQDVSLSIEKGEIFGVIGFSGAGKSTLLRLVNLLERPTTGKVIVNDQENLSLTEKELRMMRQRIGMIFQTFNLFNSRTVFGNVAYPLKLAKVPKQEINRRVTELLQFVGLADKAKYYPEQLSGGQKQRVGIARALATSPDILICDEATSALDPETTSDILNLLKKVNEEYNVTILLITHEMQVIRNICDRVAVMENGRVIEEGSVFDIFTNPKTQTTKNFISSVLNDKISSKLFEKLRSNPSSRLYRLVFTGEETSKPLLSDIAKSYQVDVNIIYGNISELQEVLFGQLIVELQGTDHEVDKAVKHLERFVQIKEVTTHAS
ncbi:methionine ABC transporter ATP-binding protein [Heyndrickxia oleronia]|uniref:Phosphate ABC transporter ATP-binding protein n=1 Tax=Heyndrickxia oleronia TaxID=38875 RepID=A0A8E2LG72_9BACI|nr:methionine ABC transporter ATP-binding protein [Heyndrickxia oleronia]NYV68030.1 methionine ABC transporter ATP-binding protein [Bacillus sp. Gen3]MBU5212302.1 methionine ABC transporter ATP-binding protein [Heyndrickxia oleronia]MCM3454676.1 methionine ABC transporter ATP-binding protein [Heyndrickxia oleronia]MEC1375107.1 methionine ABC transporter ATP-binding protein [Heyndrickxia oleronia]OOP70148.1 phosphate ABC transporter ATP-binding protein [Heyndrickxia oleronia]